MGLSWTSGASSVVGHFQKRCDSSPKATGFAPVATLLNHRVANIAPRLSAAAAYL